jgi:hypothetical protein
MLKNISIAKKLPVLFAAMTNAVRAEELTVVANELSTSTDGVSHQIARFNLGNPGSGRRATASAAPKTAPTPAAPETDAPVSNGAMMNGNASAGLDVYFGALDSTPAMSRDPVTGHRYPVNVEQAQDRGMLFSLGYDHTQVEKSRFLPSDSNASHEPKRSRTRMGMTFKRGSWSVFGGLTMMGKEFKGQDGEQVLDLFASLAASNPNDQRFLSLTSMQSPRGMPNRRPLTGVQSPPQILI